MTRMFGGEDKVLLFCGLLVAELLSMVAGGNQDAPFVAHPVDFTGVPVLTDAVPLGATPVQKRIEDHVLELADGHTADLMYHYVIAGHVVTRAQYPSDGASRISPLDLGIVWGELVAAENRAGLEFAASNRWIRYRSDSPIARDMRDRVTNNHLIPASPEVHAQMMAIEVGQNVRLTGYLVSAEGEGLLPWTSSTRRDDSGIRGCEIILLRKVEILPDLVPEAAS